MVRGQRVMLDATLAALYQVTTGNLNLAVRRNRRRFPPDFLFALTPAESAGLLLQNAIAKRRRGGRRTPPYAFTELGVAMLSSVLKSERAVQMNIVVMRAFVRLRAMMAEDGSLRLRVERLEAGQMRVRSVLEELAREIGTSGGARRRTAAARPRIGFAAGAD